MMIASPTLDEMFQVEAVLLARLREQVAPGPVAVEEGAVWGVLCSLLDDVWQGEDPAPALARLDPFPALRAGRVRFVPEDVGWVLVSLHAVLTARLGKHEDSTRHFLFRSWLERNVAAVCPTVPAYPPDETSVEVLNPALVQEIALARWGRRAPALGRFIIHSFAVEKPLPRKATLLETVALLELPREAAEALEVEAVVPEVRVRVREE